MSSVRERLNELAEEKYRIFISSLMPGVDNVIGVRTPILRKMATEIAKGDWRTFLQEAPQDTFEEVMLQGMVIGCCKADIEEKLTLSERFIPLISNWAICDSFCNGMKITLKNKERVWEFLQPYLSSDEEYKVRFGVVMILCYYVQPEYAQLVFEHFDRIKQEGYYVKMAVAWAIAEYYTALPEITIEYLRSNKLDNFTYNKALQKITESLKISKETKDEIRSMKRK